MQIETGKYYRTRDGRKVGPMKSSGVDGWPWIVVDGDGKCWHNDGLEVEFTDSGDLIAEWSDEPEMQPNIPKLWRDMTPEEKGALLLAHHEGKKIEYMWPSDKSWCIFSATGGPAWIPEVAYRVKPEPARETVKIVGGENFGWGFYGDGSANVETHRITFDLIDGVPDCASIKMEVI